MVLAQTGRGGGEGGGGEGGGEGSDAAAGPASTSVPIQAAAAEALLGLCELRPASRSWCLAARRGAPWPRAEMALGGSPAALQPSLIMSANGGAKQLVGDGQQGGDGLLG